LVLYGIPTFRICCHKHVRSCRRCVDSKIDSGAWFIRCVGIGFRHEADPFLSPSACSQRLSFFVRFKSPHGFFFLLLVNWHGADLRGSPCRLQWLSRVLHSFEATVLHHFHRLRGLSPSACSRSLLGRERSTSLLRVPFLRIGMEPKASSLLINSTIDCRKSCRQKIQTSDGSSSLPNSAVDSAVENIPAGM